MDSTPGAHYVTRLQALDALFAKEEWPLRLEPRGTGIPEGWFLGPKAENQKILTELINEAVWFHCDYRRDFHPEDPGRITPEVKASDGYKQAVDSLRMYARELFESLRRSTPFFSMRHQGHMLWDQVLPGFAGYFGAMLYNQNNVAAEASPLTTMLEIQVGNDLCRLLGFPVPPDGTTGRDGGIVPWGHITCGGTVANIEALWAARNVRFFPVAIREALQNASELQAARGLEVVTLLGEKRPLIDLDWWTVLNLKLDDVVSLPLRIEREFGVPVATTTAALGPYTLQNVGLVEFYRQFMPDKAAAPVVIVPSTRHYSWPKAATLLGLGQNSVKNVHVDASARLDVDKLDEELGRCLEQKVPVIAVVAVIGSTEESAVDPLRPILNLRGKYRRQGLDFAVHCDAAWGGYFNAMLRNAPDDLEMDRWDDVPTFPMSPYVRDQYRALREADSVTVDPHKAGYVPYPAGSLCYRNSATRDMISLAAPVVFHSTSEPTVGIYGVEGSKPGAAAAGVWLAHKVIPPTRDGYGRILGQCMWTANRLYSRLVTMTDERFTITFLQMLPAERAGQGPDAVEAQKQYIREHFLTPTNDELERLLRDDQEARNLFGNLGPDQVILTYSFNFYDSSGKLNRDVVKANALNAKVFELCSVTLPDDNILEKELIVTNSKFAPELYGPQFMKHYAERLGVDQVDQPIEFLISTVMDPWPTDAQTIGQARSTDFLVVVEQALRKAVHRALDELEFANR